MKKIGLTGGIGSGKSTVAALFKEKGVPVFIADVEAKKLFEEEEVVNEIKECFGSSVISKNSIDRKALGQIVFSDSEELKKLNNIIHPKVHQAFENWFSQQKSPYIIYEAAIIFEHNRQSFFDKTLLVTAPKALRIERVMKRDSVTEDEVLKRMNNQWPELRKKELADYTLDNVKIDKTKHQVNKYDKIFRGI
ncbi:dephospho-CoA kinase [Psychroflexus halocasei]|uniref:Dephospho-CoA kinase n=1 Tax=Psychroflexus halocasei TaxID=908615 RepID=A0A1H3XBX8_9FLAO|nr:dephospho-CoA kinase [Psychroflexus halocasei]SDZ96839.1 dephospho-CoA kinase [Psychroflexus halocasei]